MKITGAIFDMDGTLLDSMFIWETVGHEYLVRRGMEDTVNFGRLVRTNSLLKAAQMGKEGLGLSDSPEEIARGVNQLATQMYLTETKPKRDALAFLEKLRSMGVRMCVATATDTEVVVEALKKNGMDTYFDRIFSEKDTGKGKTDPGIFRAALKHLNTDKETTWIFEDALYAVKTAKADGFNTAVIHDETEPHKEEIRSLADIYFYNYSELTLE